MIITAVNPNNKSLKIIRFAGFCFLLNVILSGWPDSNWRPLVPQTSTLTVLSYIPNHHAQKYRTKVILQNFHNIKFGIFIVNFALLKIKIYRYIVN